MRPRLLALRWALLLAALLAGWPTAAAPKLRVEFLSVGQGDAALVTSPEGKRVLIDGGPRQAAPKLLHRLRGHGPLDLVVLTHRHADHLGGLEAVVRGPGTRLYMDAPFPHPSPAYAALLRALEERKVAVRQATRGRTIDLGGQARLVLLTPPEPAITGSRSDVNANGLVIRLEHRKVAVLFAGDAEPPTERWLLSTGVPLRAAALKVAHHGGASSSSLRFLRAVKPDVAVISVGANNPYGHPAPATLARLAQVGARIYRTDRDGTIVLESDGERLEVVAPAPATARSR